MASGDAGETRPQGGRFLLNVNLVFLSTVVAYGLGFLTVVLVARELGTQGRGVTALYQAAVGLGFGFLSLGLATAIVYFVGRRDMTPRSALERGVSVTAGATLLTAVAVLLTAFFFDHELRAEGVPYWMALVAVPASIQFRLLEGVLRAQGRFGAMNLLEISLPLTVLVGLTLVELVDNLTIEGAVFAWTLAFLPPVLFGYALVGLPALPRRPSGLRDLMPTALFGAQAQSGNLIQLLNYRLDSYLVLLFVNTSGVGLYAIGVSLSEGLWFIANSVAVVLLTKLTSGDDEYAQRMTPIVCRNTLLISGLAALAAAAVSPFVVPLVFGQAFDGAVEPFLWLLPGTVALAGSKILSAYIFSRGKPMINAWISLVTLVVAISADLILIPLLGVPGAAIASSLAYLISISLTARAYRRLSGKPIAEALVPRLSDLAIWTGALAGMARGMPLTAQLLGQTIEGDEE